MSIGRTVRLAALTAVFAGGCVTTGTFDAKVAELGKLKQETDAREAAQKKEIGELSARAKELDGKIAALEKDLKEGSARLTATTAARDGLQKQFDESTALVGELKKRLEKLGQNVDKLSSEKGQMAQFLDDAKARLEELRKQKAAAEARAAAFRDLMQKLRSMIDAGQLKVVIREGRMLIALESDVLFDSGKTDIKADGKTALGKLAQALATIPDRRFLVAGHTDDLPIKTARFPSNWELSTARAVEVTRFLVANGMRPQVLAAGGYGEFDPIAANDTSEHRAQNRRIEIILQPNLSDLPPLEEPKEAAK